MKNIEPYTPNDGEFLIRLDANESFYPLGAELEGKVKECIGSIEFNRYPDPLAQKLCNSFSEAYAVPSKNVVAGNGSDELISLIISGFTEKNDKILVTTPDFSMYSFYAKAYFTDCVVLDKTAFLNIDLDALYKKVEEEKPRIVIFSNPCNPTGQGVKKENLKTFVEKCNCLVVLDEAYMDFWDESESFLNEIENHENLIVLRTLSKAYGLAALRLGFAIGNAELISSLKAYKSPYNVNAFSQAVGSVLLNEKEVYNKRLQKIKENKTALEKEVKKLSDSKTFCVFDTVTNFVFLKFYDECLAKEIFLKLKEEKIAVRFFGGGYFRITAGSERENDIFLKHFASLLRKG